MLAVVSAILGRALAWMVAGPGVTPVTTTVTLVAPAAKATVGGTEATPALLELRLIATPPDGAGTDRVSVRFCVAVPIIVAIVGEKDRVAVTCTGKLAGV
jgi:hypothetical protein